MRIVQACILLLGLSANVGAGDTFPGEKWNRVAAPDEVGWSRQKLIEADDFARTLPTDAYLIVDGGAIVHEYGLTGRAANVYSVRKSILSVLMGIYADRGVVDLDKTLADLGIEIVGIIGPNGAGKTTLFNLITGFYPPDEGRIFVEGQDVTGEASFRICQRGVARTFQISKPFANLTVLQTVRIGALNRAPGMAEATARASAVLKRVGLDAKRDQLGRHLTVVERKRLEMARALATEPALLLLDEVAAGLTPTEVREMITLVRQIAADGVSVLIIEHVLEAVMRLSGRIVVLNHGQVIAEGAPRDLVTDPRVIEAYLGEAYSLA